jgi:hypothetical protein
MTTVPPFHVVSANYSTQHRHVYHDCDACHVAKNVKPEDRVLGTGGKQRCKECVNICSSM